MSANFAAGSLGTYAVLLLPPLMWAGNSVVGRVAADWIPPFALNFLRWALVLLILLPLAYRVLRCDSPLWPHWRRFMVLGFFAVAGYNTLQYLALHTSTPLNVTLVAASTPVWMLLVGRLFFSAPIHPRALLGAGFSLLGVLVVLTQGRWTHLLTLQLVPGDAWMLLAAFIWACYSWLLTQRQEPAEIRNDWAVFLFAQTVFGLVSAGALTTGEWLWLSQQDQWHIHWSPALVAVLLFIALGPSVLAYRCWSEGVQRGGPALAGIFGNLTPLFTALLSLALLGQMPQLFHVAAFGLIVLGIAITSSIPRSPAPTTVFK